MPVRQFASSPVRQLASSPVRQFAVGLMVAVASLASSRSALGATFTVNAWDEREYCPSGCAAWESPTGQGYDGICDSSFVAASGSGPGTDCTLRDAITAASATPGSDVILIPVNPDQPGIPAGGYTLTRLSPSSPTPGDDNVWGDLDVWNDAPGATLVLRGWDVSTGSVAAVSVSADWKVRAVGSLLNRLLHGQPTGGGRYGVDLEIDSVSIYSGWENHGAASIGGGCIAQVGGSLDLVSMEVGGCTEIGHGGGGVWVSSDLTMVDTSIIQNRSHDRPGGGVYATGTVDIYESTFSGNTTTSATVLAYDDGGGLFVESSSTVEIERSTFSANSAEYGGGAWLSASGVSVVDVEFVGNTAILGGGGAWMRGFDSVSGVPVFDRTSFIQNRVTGAVPFGGSGLFVAGHPTTPNKVHGLLNCTFSGNHIGDTFAPPALGTSALYQQGIAIYVDSNGASPVDLEIVQTTFNDNILYTDADPDPAVVDLKERHRTLFQRNSGGSITLQNSIVDGDCAATAGSWATSGGNTYWDEDLITGYVCPVGGSDDVGDESPGGHISIDFDNLATYSGSWTRVHATSSTKAAVPWSNSMFENRTCLGDLSQNLVTRPSSGATCDAGSYEP